MKKSILIAAFILAAALGSCTKSSVDPTDDTKDQTQSYFPLKNGYQWHYTSTTQNTPAEVVHSVVGTEVKNGKTYYKMNFTGQSTATIFYRCENNILYSIGPNTYGVDENIETINFNFNNAVGDSTVILGTDSLGHSRKCVITTDSSVGFGASDGTVYLNVISFRVSVYSLDNSEWMLKESNDYYFSKGIGLVGIDYANHGGQGSDRGALGWLELKRYSFK